jgi:hypothetical protein
MAPLVRLIDCLFVCVGKGNAEHCNRMATGMSTFRVTVTVTATVTVTVFGKVTVQIYGYSYSYSYSIINNYGYD